MEKITGTWNFSQDPSAVARQIARRNSTTVAGNLRRVRTHIAQMLSVPTADNRVIVLTYEEIK